MTRHGDTTDNPAGEDADRGTIAAYLVIIAVALFALAVASAARFPLPAAGTWAPLSVVATGSL